MSQQFFAPQQYAMPMVPPSQVPEGMQATRMGPPHASVLVPIMVSTEHAPTLQKEAAETVPTPERVQNQSNASSESGATLESTPKKESTLSWSTPKKESPNRELPAPKRTPPGFEKKPWKD